MEEKMVIPIIAIVIILSFSFYYLFNYDFHSLSPPFEPPIAASCSIESISTVWDSIFELSSSGATIIFNSSDTGVCDGYYAYKIVSDETYVLGGWMGEGSPENATQVMAMKGNFTNQANMLITSVTEDEIDGQHMFVFLTIITDPDGSANPRPTQISSGNEARIEFNSVFKPKNQSAFGYHSLTNSYNFSYQEESGNDTIINAGIVGADNDTSFFTTLEIGDIELTCTPNWIEFQGNCTSSDTYDIYYIDTNSCPNPIDPPENETEGCDFDDNGLIGDEDDINDTYLNIDLFVDNETNASGSYSGNLKVELKEGSKVRVSFNHDFSSKPLNLKKIAIEKQPSSSDRGYLIVNGINEYKTIVLDRLSTFSSKVCMINRHTNIISNSCTNSFEEIFDCPGDEGILFCDLDESTITFTGLEHSAVKEFLGECTPNWDCTDWSVCSDNEQTRSCSDINNCGIVTGKPYEIQICTSCIPEWDCTSWEPTLCPEEEIKTRVCTDINDCGIEEGASPEEKQCIYKTTIWYLVAIVTAVALIALIAIISASLALKRESVSSKKSSQVSASQVLYPSPKDRQHIPSS